MNWTPGPARCRSPEYEAEIAFTDMPGDWPLYGRIRLAGQEWVPMSWMSNGRVDDNEDCNYDLMPPTITRDALAEELRNMGVVWEAVVAHVIDAVKSGRVE